MRQEANLRAEMERLQRRIEYHQRVGGAAGEAIARVYGRMLALKRRRLVGADGEQQ